MTDTTKTPAAEPDHRDPTPNLTDTPGAEDLQTGDFGLEGDLRKVMVDALEKRWNADDPGSVTLEDDEDPGQTLPDSTADTAATPAPASSPDAGDTAGQGVGAGGGGDAVGEGAAPDSTAPPAPAPSQTQEEFDLNQYARDYFGTNLSPEQARSLFSMVGGLQAMSPEQRAQLDQILTNGQQGQYPATTGQPVTQQDLGIPAYQQPVPTPDPAVQILGPRPEDEYEARQWDITAQGVRAQQAQLEQIQADIARNTQMELERQNAEMVSRVESASTAWRESHPVLTPGEFDALSDEIVRSGTFPALIRTHNGNIEAATNAALEQFFWGNPAYRERAIANLASGRVAGDPSTPDPNSPITQQANETEAGRQARAASVAGGGGSATPRGTVAPKTKADRKDAMVATLAAEGDF